MSRIYTYASRHSLEEMTSRITRLRTRRETAIVPLLLHGTAEFWAFSRGRYIGSYPSVASARRALGLQARIADRLGAWMLRTVQDACLHGWFGARARQKARIERWTEELGR